MTTHVNDKIFKSCSPITKVVTHSKLVNRPAWESCLKLMYSIHGSSRHFCLRVENCLPQQNNSGKRQDCLMQTIWAASLSVEINGSINPRIDRSYCMQNIIKLYYCNPVCLPQLAILYSADSTSNAGHCSSQVDLLSVVTLKNLWLEL